VCGQVEPPEGVPDGEETMRAKVVDSWFEMQRGVICLLQILSGKISEGDRIVVLPPSSVGISSDSKNKNGLFQSIGSQESFSVQDIGLVLPHRVRTKGLSCGQMGYAIIGMRDPRHACPGSYLILHKDIPRLPHIVLPVPEVCANGFFASSAAGEEIR